MKQSMVYRTAGVTGLSLPFFVRRRGVTVGIALLLLATVPAYLRALVIAGDSDAPALITGDRVVVNFAAYDVRFPYTSWRLARFADPAPGDMVVFRDFEGRLMVKRVLAGPGTRVAMRDNHVVIDGRTLEYAAVEARHRDEVSRGLLGAVVEIERGNGPEVYISFDPGRGARHHFEEQIVPEDAFFVLGSNRDISTDSRSFGSVSRSRILGRVLGRVWSGG